MLRADIFPERWDVVPLGEAVTFLDNMRRPVTASDRVAGPYPYYGANGIQGTIDGFIFDEPLLLLAEDGGNFGNPDRDIAYIADGRYWVNNHAHVIRPKASLDLRFLYRVLQRYDVTPFIKGATRAKLTKGDASLIPIPLPPLPEQKRIAAILDKADAIRRKRQQAIQLADNFLRAVFLEMFGDPVTNPKGWDEYVLNEISDIRSGVTKGKAVKPEESVTRPYMRVANVQDGYLDLADVQRITVSKRDAEKCLLLEGDILLTEGGDPDKLGRGHVWCGEVEGCLHQNHIFSVRVNDKERVRPAFLSAIISSPRGKRYFLKVGKQTTGIATINKSVLSEFVPFVPPVALQDKYLAVVKRIGAVKQSLAEGDVELFSSLSQKAFSGQL
ncbi:type I restriction enzyme, S subunit [Pseudomonas delhiensis]|uniref:Type I restriction enzyme, S subunit n=1 Tax=Pseudomonas delhiensis TaxID=366289 RepID=A0A239HKC0_9PSED|nr:restriction endonuclease subunit S [Pseudomonas delhiensis]SDK49631.1 type I restriction enzyme, S subunit [Pseudomonas delhiensis]SNS81797.1 type I restriction enzyme, S subunit [Pseudomonas delhiensis]